MRQQDHLIPKFGYSGYSGYSGYNAAAGTTLISYEVLFVLHYINVQLIFKMKDMILPFRIIGFPVVLILLLSLGFVYIKQIVPSHLLPLTIKILLLNTWDGRHDF